MGPVNCPHCGKDFLSAGATGGPMRLPRLGITHPDFDSEQDIYNSGWNACVDRWFSPLADSSGGRLADAIHAEASVSTAADIPAIEAIKKKVYIAYYDCAVNSRVRNMLSEVIADLNAAQSLPSATAGVEPKLCPVHGIERDSVYGCKKCDPTWP